MNFQLHREGVSGTISGTQIRSVNSLTLFTTVHYYTGKRRDQFRFYFGLGAGMYYIKQKLECNAILEVSVKIERNVGLLKKVELETGRNICQTSSAKTS